MELALIYELKLLDQIGYRPVIENCIVNGIPVLSETADTMKLILHSDLEKAQEVPMIPTVRQELNKVLPAYIQEKLELKISSRAFLNLIA